MLRIGALLPSSSYAPELYALESYLARTNDVRMLLLHPDDVSPKLTELDVLYRKMGYAPIWKSSPLPEIHDYASASGGKAKWLKDTLKSRLSRRPVLRSFLSDEVERRIPFRDNVPYIYRDMGVPAEFLAAAASRSESPNFDFFYAGSISRSRNTAELFRCIERADMTILAAGAPEDSIYHEFKLSSRIEFAGRVTVLDIPTMAAECRMGINFTPDTTPYNVQTSTKVLEYLALGLPVVTNDYRWVRVFEAASGANMLKLNRLDALDKRAIDYPFVVPDMSTYTWPNVFDRAEILTALQSLVEF